MREKLNAGLGKRKRYTATFAGTGIKDKGAYPDICYPVNMRTVVLRHITNEAGEEIADHLWVGMTKYLWSLINGGTINNGDRITFLADVKKYTRSKRRYWYRVKEQDLTICNMGEVEKVET